jgi:3-methyladenine DNA glycosylase AlkC
MKSKPQPSALHPAQRFAAPGAIERGVPLRQLIGPALVALLAESFAAVAPQFDARRFRRQALEGLESLELGPRAARVATALAEQLPADFRLASPLLVAALGPELPRTAGNGLATFFYLPHSHLIATRGTGDFGAGMQANYELTKRFTAEFSIRPFLLEQQERALRLLAKWAKDPNPHVRRLVSEGTRPRLPWAMRLRAFQQDPSHTLPLLERLKDDPEPYVQRSVANHLGDLLKDHPDAVFGLCETWVDQACKLPAARAKARLWIVRHAVRLPARKGDARALALRARATLQ